MNKYINLKKLTSNTLIGILLAGSLVAESSNKQVFAGSCGNNGYGNNIPVTISLSTGNLTITKYDPGNPSNFRDNGKGEGDLLIEDLNAGKFGEDNMHQNAGYLISFDGSSYNLANEQIDASVLVKDLPDLEKNSDGTLDDCGSYNNENDTDYDNDGINNITEVGSDPDNPLDTDNDGIDDFVDTDSDNDGIDDSVEGTTDTDGDGIDDYLDRTDNSNSPNTTAILTADNHYGLFTGNNNGSDLNYIGRNEYGPSGNPGTYNWSQAETWNLFLDDDDYIYVVVWDDASVDESWIGEFTLSTGETLLTVEGDWEYIIASGSNPGDYGEVPSNSELQSEISGANWQSVQRRGDNGMSPWGTIAGISGDADFLNTTTPSNGNYTIFRTKFAVKPKLTTPTPVDVNDTSVDSDNDGISDIVEIGSDPTNPTDSDGDNTPDYQDTDSDNNDILDIVEVGSNPSNPTDTDGDGKDDYQDTDDDDNGILDVNEIGNHPSNPGYDVNGDGTDDIEPEDLDSDTIPDYLDPDDDGDGILDVVEIGSDPTNPTDSDGDSTPDYQDTDSDNNGILDVVEIGSNPSNPTDTDGDGKDDYQDTDDDNNGILDVNEIGNHPNNPGYDVNGDGTDDINPDDFDGDDIPDYLDLDDDDDGLNDSVEGTTDSNLDNDNDPNYQDLDSDGDTIPDSVEGANDFDNDNDPNYQDLDSDGDTIPDSVEAIGAAPNDDLIDSDGFVYDPINSDAIDELTINDDSDPDYLDTDSDGDNLDDIKEVGDDPNNPVNSDNDDAYDYQEYTFSD